MDFHKNIWKYFLNKPKYSYQFLSKSIKVDLQSQFLGSKNVIFFWYPKKHTKDQKFKKRA